MNNFCKSIPIIIFLLFPLFSKAQKTVEYDLYVKDTLVTYTDHKRAAMAINGQIPSPTLYFTEGDTAVIRVHNMMHSETSIHWHGLLVPNEQDGVPYLTSAPVKPHTTHTYTFPVRQSGTYWYHSHSGMQEQMGLYGAFIIRKRENDPKLREEDKLPEYTILLSDWSDEDAMEINRKLHIGSDWYAIKKGSVQSYYEALRSGHLKTKFINEWKRMKAMDVSDIYYDRFLANGTEHLDLSQFKAGEKIRLRIINGSASTYFWLQYAGGKISVIASDGQDVEPVEANRMIIAVSETYDIVISIPEKNTSYELLATAEDRTRSTSVWLGEGTKKAVPPLPKLKYFEGMKMMNGMMKMNGDLNNKGMHMSLQQMDMNEVMYPELSASEHTEQEQAGPVHDHHEETDKMEDTGHHHMDMNEASHADSGHSDHHHSMKMSQSPVTLNYNMLKSPDKTNLPSDAPTRELHFELTGNMNRYVWTLNNKTVSESDKILIKEGENLRIILYNNSMMRHPMHLHGHFFRVINSHGDYAPLKNVIDIMPMETDTIEFNASEKSRGDWYFHCHILYHMMSGMGRIFSYEDSPPNPQVPDPAKTIKKVYKDDQAFFFTILGDFSTNANNGQLEYSNTRWSTQAEWKLGYEDEHGYEVEARAGRYIGKMQWLFPYIGVEWKYRKGETGTKNMFGQEFDSDQNLAAIIGIRYTLPLLLVADARVDMYGKARLQFEREDIPLTSRLRMNLMANTNREYMAGLRYIVTPYVSFSLHYDNHMKWGAGVILNY